MLTRLVSIAAATVVLAAAPAVADQDLRPPWMTVDAATRMVSFRIVGAADGSHGTMNFNGYGQGEMSLIVPLGWRVRIDFENKGLAALPHSLVVTHEASPLPVENGKPAFPRALTIRLVEGLLAGEQDSMEFVASKEGRYLLFCGVTGHGVAGMWDYFVVSREATEPIVRVGPRPAPPRSRP
jgi:sulfocyanin